MVRSLRKTPSRSSRRGARAGRARECRSQVWRGVPHKQPRGGCASEDALQQRQHSGAQAECSSSGLTAELQSARRAQAPQQQPVLLAATASLARWPPTCTRVVRQRAIADDSPIAVPSALLPALDAAQFSSDGKAPADPEASATNEPGDAAEADAVDELYYAELDAQSAAGLPDDDTPPPAAAPESDVTYYDGTDVASWPGHTQQVWESAALDFRATDAAAWAAEQASVVQAALDQGIQYWIDEAGIWHSYAEASEVGYAAYDAAYEGGYGYEHASGGEAVDAHHAAQDFSGEHGGAADAPAAYGGFGAAAAGAGVQEEVARSVAEGRGAVADVDADADPARAGSESVWQYRGRALDNHEWQEGRAYDIGAIRRREAARGFQPGQRAATPSSNRTYPTGWLSPEFAESVKLNEKLLACEDIVRLGAVVEERLDDMKTAELGTVCLTTALHRAALFWTDLQAEAAALVAAQDPRDVTALVEKQRATYFDPVVERLHIATVIKLCASHHTTPYDVAIALWSLASLRQYHPPSFDALLVRAVPTLRGGFKPVDVAHIFWACGLMRHRSGSVVLQIIAEACVPVLEDFRGRELAATTWGMAHTGCWQNAIMLHAAGRILEAPAALRAREIASIVYSFTKIKFARVRDTGVFAAAVDELTSAARLATLNPQDITMVAWAVARAQAEVGADCVEALAARALDTLGEFHVGEVAVSAYAFARLGRAADCGELLCALASRALENPRAMCSRELSLVLWGLGHAVVATDAAVLEAFEKEFYSRMRSLQPHTMSNVVKAFAKLHHTPRDQFLAALADEAVRRVHRFQMAEMANLLWALAQLQYRDDALCEVAEEYVMDSLDVCTQHHVTSVVGSLRGLGYRPEDLISSARACDFQV